jgi:hypothetical protein
MRRLGLGNDGDSGHHANVIAASLSVSLLMLLWAAGGGRWQAVSNDVDDGGGGAAMDLNGRR